MADDVKITRGVESPPQSVSTPSKKFEAGGGNLELDWEVDEMYNLFEGSWTLGNWIKDGQNPARATDTAACWNWILEGGIRQRMSGAMVGIDNTKATSPRLYRRKFYPVNGHGISMDSIHYDTAPPTGKILAIELQVFCTNPVSPHEGFGMPSSYAMYEFEVPLPPTIEISYDSDETKEVTFALKSAIDMSNTSDNHERYKTELVNFRRVLSYGGHRIEEFASRYMINDNNELRQKEYSIVTGGEDGSIFPSGNNASLLNNLKKANEFILYTINAYNVGIRGEGPTTKDYYRRSPEKHDTEYVIGIPPQASISGVEANDEYLYVKLKGPVRNSVPEEIRNVDNPPIIATLQKAITTEKSFRDNPANLQWSDVSGATGTADTITFREPVSDAKSVLSDDERGKYAYYRMKTVRGNSSPSYSAPFQSRIFYRGLPTAVGTNIEIAGWKLDGDGKTLELYLKWNEDEADEIEITMSHDKSAWTDAPYFVDGTGGNVPNGMTLIVVETSEETDPTHTKKVIISSDDVDLRQQPISAWYIRARRRLSENKSVGNFNDKDNPSKMTEVYPSAAADDDVAEIAGLTRDREEDTVTVDINWHDVSGNNDPKDRFGTQFQWSTSDDLSVNSTVSPSTQDVDDPKGASVSLGKQSLVIHDIDGGTTIRVRARRYMYDSEGDKSYSETWSKQSTLAITAEDDAVAILGIEQNGDGESLKIRIGWNEDDSDGTELSWSKKDYAWESSTSPSTFNVTWDGRLSEGTGWKYETDASIDGLEVGETYYIRARRFQEGNKSTFGSYTETRQAVPYTKAEDVVANAAEYHPKGKDLEVSWTFTSESDQTAYVIQSCVANALGGYDKADVLSSQNGDSNGTSIPSAVVEQHAVDGVLRLIVTVTTGGGSADSQMLTVNVVDPPTCAVEMSDEDSVVDSIRDVRFKIKSNSKTNRFTVQLAAHGASLSLPDRVVFQSLGEILWSGEVSGADLGWSDDGVAEYVIPESLAESDEYLVNGARYEVRVFAHDDFTKLSMEDPSTAQFTVQFSEKQNLLSDDTLFEIDSDRLAATFDPELVEGAPSGTLVRIYRATRKQVKEIATDDPTIDRISEVTSEDGTTKTVETLVRYEDTRVPFGNDADLHYDIMVETPDGDIQIYRANYELDARFVRIEWDNGKEVDVPYNLTPSDTYTKDFERRSYLDGSQNGFYNPAVTHDGSIGSAIFHVIDESDLPEPIAAEQREILSKLRQLQVHPGPAFVRTPDGAAFAANVEVEKLDPKYDTLTYDIKLKFNEFDTPDSYNATIRTEIVDVETE